jgi:hypothetical protein
VSSVLSVVQRDIATDCTDITDNKKADLLSAL